MSASDGEDQWPKLKASSSSKREGWLSPCSREASSQGMRGSLPRVPASAAYRWHTTLGRATKWTLAEAEAAGATLLKPGEEASWGGYSGYFSDPDGFPWEVAWNPSFPMMEDGSIRIPD